MFLGIDIGTSGVKVILLNEDDQVVVQASAPLAVSHPAPLMAEQNPADWWAATNHAVHGLDAALRRQVRAIGLSGQMHGATVLDEADQPLRPAILWNDGRSGAQCRALEERVADLPALTGNLAMPGFTAPKLVWLQDHEPALFAKIRKVLLPKDYIRLCMTGDHASDMSDSAGTLWLDPGARDWSDTMLAATGLTRDHMPALFEGNAATGTLSPAVSDDWGMGRVPVAAGGGDNAAGAVGSGVVREGEAFLSLGTSGVIFLSSDRYRPYPAGGVHAFCHALPGRWHQMAVMLSAASAIDWTARQTGFPDPAALYAAAEERATPAATEIFLPYLTGERTPHNNPHAQGLFFGLTATSDAVSMAQAALEGVAYGLADGLDALTATGAPVKTISVIGGGARSAYWGKILSAVLGHPLTYRDGGEVGPAHGAARLARLALTGEDVDSVCTPPPVKTVIEPDAGLRAHYGARRHLFTSLYERTQDLFAENVS